MYIYINKRLIQKIILCCYLGGDLDGSSCLDLWDAAEEEVEINRRDDDSGDRLRLKLRADDNLCGAGGGGGGGGGEGDS